MSSLPKLNAFQLKWIALGCMTIDHLAGIGCAIPLFTALYTPMRLVGRIAAPVFLFLLVQSVRHTRNRKKFLLRLYLAGVAAGLFTTAANYFLGDIAGYFTPPNILFTFFFTVLYIQLAEMLMDGWKSRSPKRALAALTLFAASFLPNLMWKRFILPAETPLRYRFLAEDLRDSFLPATLYSVLDYGLPFICLGVVLYFAKTPKRQCWLFAGFCVLCLLGACLATCFPDIYHIKYTSTYFNSLQIWMVLALPLMCLYNGSRGRSLKGFFYAYYPLHRYAIFIIASFFA